MWLQVGKESLITEMIPGTKLQVGEAFLVVIEAVELEVYKKSNLRDRGFINEPFYFFQHLLSKVFLPLMGFDNFLFFLHKGEKDN